MSRMIRRCQDEDFDNIWSVINEGAAAYKGVIPQDCNAEPYMSRSKLRNELDHGVIFWGDYENAELIGVMGLQDVREVTLIRHAYVRTRHQRKGVGARLLQHLTSLTERPILIGTWADATWAIVFYQKHGFQLTDAQEKDRLLRTYWKISDRQIETSVVLANQASIQSR